MWHQWFNLNFMKLLFVHKESKILFTNIFSFLSVLDGRSWQYHAFVWWWAEECTRMRRGTLKNKKKRRKWCVIKYGDPYSEFVPIHLTHPSAHTYSSKHTHGAVGCQCCSAWGAVVIRCLAQEHLSHDIEGGESAGYSLLHLPSLLDLRLEPATFGFWFCLSNH